MNEKDYFIFTRELIRLLDEYGRCPAGGVKEEIRKDIQLLRTAIDLLSRSERKI